jgi:hypothetical protein
MIKFSWIYFILGTLWALAILIFDGPRLLLLETALAYLLSWESDERFHRWRLIEKAFPWKKEGCKDGT